MYGGGHVGIAAQRHMVRQMCVLVDGAHVVTEGACNRLAFKVDGFADARGRGCEIVEQGPVFVLVDAREIGQHFGDVRHRVHVEQRRGQNIVERRKTITEQRAARVQRFADARRRCRGHFKARAQRVDVHCGGAAGARIARGSERRTP